MSEDLSAMAPLERPAVEIVQPPLPAPPPAPAAAEPTAEQIQAVDQAFAKDEEARQAAALFGLLTALPVVGDLAGDHLRSRQDEEEAEERERKRRQERGA